MSIAKITAFQTRDNKLFTTVEEAQAHEDALDAKDIRLNAYKERADQYKKQFDIDKLRYHYLKNEFNLISKEISNQKERIRVLQQSYSKNPTSNKNKRLRTLLKALRILKSTVGRILHEIKQLKNKYPERSYKYFYTSIKDD